MNTFTRRDFIRSIAGGIIICSISYRNAGAADKAALLVAPPGKLQPDLRGLAGMRVCAGANANAPGSIYPELLRKRGATIVSIPLPDRFEALEKGVCGALLFVSDKKNNNELAEELIIFFPRLKQYEFKALPIN